MEVVSEWKSFGGVQRIYQHESETCACPMRFAVYLPPQAASKPVPTLTWLSGLTCSEENFIAKAGAQRLAAKLGLMIVAPDTSPRGDAVPDDPEAWDFGKGAGFYVDATEEPWSEHYRMYSYVTDELQSVMLASLPMEPLQQGIFGHSMGGHGALVLHLRNPERYRSISAFAPIVTPMRVPWGEKAFSRYLGSERAAWRRYDATELVSQSPSSAAMLIDQGGADDFLPEQLQPEQFQAAAEAAGQEITLRMQPGYDHSYYFIATFMEDHLRHHADALAA